MKWIKENIAFTLCIVGCVVLILVLFRECENKANLEKELMTVTSFLEIEKTQSISRDSINAQEVFEMKQHLLTETSARILLKEEFERFKSISSHVRTETITRVDSFFIPYSVDPNDVLNDYTDCVPVDSVKKYFTQIPKGVNYNDTWFSFNGFIDSLGLNIDSLSMINKFDVTIGYKKPDKPLKFLRKKQPVVELISYNPYTSVNYVNNIIIEDSKGSIFVSKPAFLIYGLTAGYLFEKLNQ